MRRRRSMRAALATMAAAAAVSAEPAAARITFDGIGDARLGMTEDALTDELGPPSAVEAADRPKTTRLVFRRHRLEAMLHEPDDRVVALRTTSRAQKTASGVGVGTSVAAMRRRLRNERCGSAQRLRVCFIDGDDAVMEFFHRGGRVVEVGLAHKD